jgi:hypothetical protein
MNNIVMVGLMITDINIELETFYVGNSQTIMSNKYLKYKHLALIKIYAPDIYHSYEYAFEEE